jgi:hypothetical protein
VCVAVPSDAVDDGAILVAVENVEGGVSACEDKDPLSEPCLPAANDSVSENVTGVFVLRQL